jgi:hypothetical protein
MNAFMQEKMGQRPQPSDAEEQLDAKVTELDAKVTELTEKMAACNAKGVELTDELVMIRNFWNLANREAETLQAAGELKLQTCVQEIRQEKRARIDAEIADEDCREKLQKANTQGSGGGRKKKRKSKKRKSKKRQSNKRKTKRKKRSKRH